MLFNPGVTIRRRTSSFCFRRIQLFSFVLLAPKLPLANVQDFLSIPPTVQFGLVAPQIRMEGFRSVVGVTWVLLTLVFSVVHAQSPVGDTRLDEPLEKPITLYDESDPVYELYDETIDIIYESKFIWVVEFYAHW